MGIDSACIEDNPELTVQSLWIDTINPIIIDDIIILSDFMCLVD